MSATVDCRRCGTPVPGEALFCAQCGEGVKGNDAANGHGRLRDRLSDALGDRYKVGDVLGAGGMGVVFLARDAKRKRKVAIKVLSPDLAADEKIVERFGREARTAAGLKHPGIVPTYEAGDKEGLHYIVMRYVDGRPLDEVLRDQSPAPIPFATRVLREAALALAHAHRKGVVHRDVKPENIIIDSKGRVLLADFGISKAIDAKGDATTIKKLTQTGGIVGTPHYMAPEHALGHHVDGRTDQYALAVVGFHMLAGRVPFDDETLPAIIHLHINEAAPALSSLRPDVPPQLAAAIARAMSKAPTNRFASMEEFAGALGSEPARRQVGRRASWAAAALLIAGVTGGVAWAWQNGWQIPGWTDVATVAPTAPTMQVPPAVVTAVSTTPPPAPTRAPPATPTRATVRFDVTSSPNAAVFIDGRRIGVTPIAQGQLSVGVHELRLERTGYRTRRDTIRVSANTAVRRTYVLRRQGR
jgi:tRNA A-37 threonylcarbamoyl transferase component Bud32